MTQAVKDRPSVWRKPPEMPEGSIEKEVSVLIVFEKEGVSFVYRMSRKEWPKMIDISRCSRWAYVSDLLEC